MLDEEVLEPDLSTFREDGCEVDPAASDVGLCPALGHVLDVTEREAAGESLEVVEGIATPFDGPVQIDLEFDVNGVGFVQENVERHVTVDGLELEIVVVVCESESGLRAGLANCVAEICPGSIAGDR